MWGAQGGINPQRADLWWIDFSQVVNGLNGQLNRSGIVHDLDRFGGDIEAHYVSSVKMPTVKVKADEFRRDSRPYMMPGFDEPLSEIGVSFIMESPVSYSTSKVYQFLEMWRAFVRAGRGAMGAEKSIKQLGTNFRVDFRFPVTIILLRGNANPQTLGVSSVSGVSSEYYGTLGDLNQQLAGLSEEQKNRRISQILVNAGVDVSQYPVDNHLERCALFGIERMWLSSFKPTDLDYSKGNEIVRIDATFYADSITDLNNKPQA